MTTKAKILRLLTDNHHQWVSGEELSHRLGISRTAVWKQINNLKADGHRILSAPKKGYCLEQIADLISADGLQAMVQTRVMGRQAVRVLQETDSTNLQAKIMAGRKAAEGTLIVADTQTLGRGRRGRTWHSPPGRNIHASLILRPKLAPSQAPQVTLMAAVALARTLEVSATLDAKIKWPNDVMVGGKKIAGILTEISTDMESVDYVVVGFGINVNIRKSEMPEALRPIATSIFMEKGTETSRTHLLCDLMENIEAAYDLLNGQGFGPVMQQWRSMTDIIGQRVCVDVMGRRHTGTVEAVDDDGVLILKDDQGVLHRILSGDVTRLRPEDSKS
jgi:BirA family transcriptional regulator, biotin operon repressor / biotin---[acetyl-CoA-carboxylase] ligase